MAATGGCGSQAQGCRLSDAQSMARAVWNDERCSCRGQKSFTRAGERVAGPRRPWACLTRCLLQLAGHSRAVSLQAMALLQGCCSHRPSPSLAVWWWRATGLAPGCSRTQLRWAPWWAGAEETTAPHSLPCGVKERQEELCPPYPPAVMCTERASDGRASAPPPPLSRPQEDQPRSLQVGSTLAPP